MLTSRTVAEFLSCRKRRGAVTQNGTRTTRVQKSLRQGSEQIERRKTKNRRGGWDTTKGGPGQGGREQERCGRATILGRAAGPRIGPRSQVEIHNAAQVASSKLCTVAAVRGAALWYAPREAAGPYRCAARAGWGPAPAPIRLGLFGFPLTLAISTPGMHIAALGESRLPPSLPPSTPVLDLSITRSSPPSLSSFRPSCS